MSQGVVRVAGGVARNVFAFSITLLGIYALLIDGEAMTKRGRSLLRALFPGAAQPVLDHVGAVVRAVVFGLVGTAIVQGVMAGIGLAIFRVPSPVAFGAMTSVLSFVPAGPPLIWGGAAVWLFANGHTGAAVGMAVWGLLLVSSVDNVLRPILIGRSGEAQLPFLLIFFGVLGGLSTFGLVGLFLGPVLLSVAFTLLSDFSRGWAPPPAADS
jgi:predicted PurR-regulated permease PerM